MKPQKNIFASLWEMIRHTGIVFVSRKTPLYVKLLLGAGLLYIISPYDLIPDFIPGIGIVDDLTLAAMMIAWASRFQE